MKGRKTRLEALYVETDAALALGQVINGEGKFSLPLAVVLEGGAHPRKADRCFDSIVIISTAATDGAAIKQDLVDRLSTEGNTTHRWAFLRDKISVLEQPQLVDLNTFVQRVARGFTGSYTGSDSQISVTLSGSPKSNPLLGGRQQTKRQDCEFVVDNPEVSSRILAYVQQLVLNVERGTFSLNTSAEAPQLGATATITHSGVTYQIPQVTVIPFVPVSCFVVKLEGRTPAEEIELDSERAVGICAQILELRYVRFCCHQGTNFYVWYNTEEEGATSPSPAHVRDSILRQVLHALEGKENPNCVMGHLYPEKFALTLRPQVATLHAQQFYHQHENLDLMGKIENLPGNLPDHGVFLPTWLWVEESTSEFPRPTTSAHDGEASSTVPVLGSCQIQLVTHGSSLKVIEDGDQGAENLPPSNEEFDVLFHGLEFVKHLEVDSGRNHLTVWYIAQSTPAADPRAVTMEDSEIVKLVMTSTKYSSSLLLPKEGLHARSRSTAQEKADYGNALPINVASALEAAISNVNGVSGNKVMKQREFLAECEKGAKNGLWPQRLPGTNEEDRTFVTLTYQKQQRPSSSGEIPDIDSMPHALSVTFYPHREKLHGQWGEVFVHDPRGGRHNPEAVAICAYLQGKLGVQNAIVTLNDPKDPESRFSDHFTSEMIEWQYGSGSESNNCRSLLLSQLSNLVAGRNRNWIESAQEHQKKVAEVHNNAVDPRNSDVNGTPKVPPGSFFSCPSFPSDDALSCQAMFDLTFPEVANEEDLRFPQGERGIQCYYCEPQSCPNTGDYINEGVARPGKLWITESFICFHWQEGEGEWERGRFIVPFTDILAIQWKTTPKPKEEDPKGEEELSTEASLVEEVPDYHLELCVGLSSSTRRVLASFDYIQCHDPQIQEELAAHLNFYLERARPLQICSPQWVQGIRPGTLEGVMRRVIEISRTEESSQYYDQVLDLLGEQATNKWREESTLEALALIVDPPALEAMVNLAPVLAAGGAGGSVATRDTLHYVGSSN